MTKPAYAEAALRRQAISLFDAGERASTCLYSPEPRQGRQAQASVTVTPSFRAGSKSSQTEKGFSPTNGDWG